MFLILKPASLFYLPSRIKSTLRSRRRFPAEPRRHQRRGPRRLSGNDGLHLHGEGPQPGEDGRQLAGGSGQSQLGFVYLDFCTFLKYNVDFFLFHFSMFKHNRITVALNIPRQEN